MLPNVHSLSDSENALSRRLTHSAEASLTQKLLKPPTKGTLTTTHNKAHLHSPHVLQCLPAPPPLKGGFYMYHFHIIKDIKLDSRNIFFIFFLQKKKSSPLPSPTAPMFLISLSYLKVLSKVWYMINKLKNVKALSTVCCSKKISNYCCFLLLSLPLLLITKYFSEKGARPQSHLFIFLIAKVLKKSLVWTNDF